MSLRKPGRRWPGVTAAAAVGLCLAVAAPAFADGGSSAGAHS